MSNFLSRPTAAAERTRMAIVSAAIEVLAGNNGAALSDIAAAAGLSRSTLHRQFADRDALISAVDAECRLRFQEAMVRARLEHGTALDALERLAMEYLALGSVLGLIFADNAIIDPDGWASEGHQDPIDAMTQRGRVDGSLDPDQSAAWVSITFWVLLFGGWLGLSQGIPRADVQRQLSRTVRKTFGP